MDVLREVRHTWAFYRDRRPDSYDGLVAPSPTGRQDDERTHHRAARSSTRADLPTPTCSSTARDRRPGRPGLFDAARVERGCRPGHRRHRQYVIPGGIDVHTHMEMPFGGTYSVDTFETGTRRGLRRHHHDHRLRHPVQGHQPARGPRPRGTSKADGNCAIDYGFHMIVSDVTTRRSRRWTSSSNRGRDQLQALHGLPRRLLLDDGEILRAMQQAASNGATIMMHAENGIAIDVLVAQALSPGETDPRYHGLTRPAELEGEATTAPSCWPRSPRRPLYIVHLSAREALEEVVAARDLGARTSSPRPARSTCSSRGRPRAPGFEGRQVRLLAAAARAREHHARCGGAAHQRPRSCPPTTARSASRSRRNWASGLLQDPQRHLPGVEHRWTCIYQGVVTRARSPWRAGSRSLDHAGADVRPLPAQGRHRARLRRRHRGLRPRGTTTLGVRPTT
jgi:hypothetical protein